MRLTPGQLIHLKRREQKLTAKMLSEKSGVPMRTIYAIERGENFGNVKTLQKVLHALGYDLEYKLVPLTASKNEKAV
jgi:Helix-turn-helix.